MVRSVDQLNITNWTVTGSNVPFPQYQFDIELWWTTDDGVRHHHADTYQFPNDISDMPLKVRRTHAEEMIYQTVRVALGIDEWEDYN